MLQVWEVVRDQTRQVAEKEAEFGIFYNHTHYFECYANGGDTPVFCPPDFNRTGALKASNLPTLTLQPDHFANCSAIGSHSCTLRCAFSDTHICCIAQQTHMLYNLCVWQHCNLVSCRHRLS